MTDEEHHNFSALLEKNIVTPIKQKFTEFSEKVSKQEKRIRLIQLWLLVISILLLGNIIVGVFLLTHAR
jgi:hypothetical protein